VKQIEKNDETGVKHNGLKFTLKKNNCSDSNKKIINSINEEISNKGFAISTQEDKPAYLKS